MGKSDRRTVTRPASRASAATSPKRSGWRRAPIASAPGDDDLTLTKARSTALSSPRIVLAATTTWRLGDKRKNRNTGSLGLRWVVGGGGSSVSSFKLPVTVTRDGSAPR